MWRGLFLLVALLGFFVSFAQKSLTAVKTLQVPVIDGKLDDAVWQQAAVATDFIQSSPDYGKPASVSSQVKILYDDNAIYIGAYLCDDPSSIKEQLTARDAEQQQNTDYFSVFFDTYNDQQNGFQFLVTPANVQTDAKLNATANGSWGDFGDRSWNAVWQSQTSITKDGWIVEMRIPYLSLRFAKKNIQTWGLQFLRFIRRKNESDYWNPVDPHENGFINQFGKCTNLQNIKPPLRLSLSPYLSGGIRYYPEGYGKEKEILHNGGMDIKYGINESFTLDATLIPDFGQVISDNVVNNLTPFEQQFQENRSFFTEGTELFTKSGLFYSRRIGAVPTSYYDVEGLDKYTILKNPSLTQLLNAFKLSGRTKNKLGIGIFNAVTAPMHAEVQNIMSGADSVIETEPLTNYNLIVLDQALKGRSSITFTNTNVMRNGAARDANVSGLDLSFFSNNNQYQLKTTGRYSSIFGYTPYKEDNITLPIDTTRINGTLMLKPYSGFKNTFLFGKVSGKIQFNVNTNVESDTYDPNDMGYLQRANKVIYNGSVSYNQLTATNDFITYRYSLNSRYTYLYKPYVYNRAELYGTALWVFKNFWDVTVNVGTVPTTQYDYYELRTPNRYLQRPAFHYVSAMGSTDSRKKLFFNYQLGYSHTELQDGNYYLAEGGLRYRFNNRFTLSLDVTNENDETQLGYAFQREQNGDPIVGYRRNIQTTAVLSGIYNFTSRINLNLHTRHYWNQVTYKNFFDVASDGSLIERPFMSGQDENYNLFNLDAFLSWDFRLGSRMIVGYKNWLGNPYGVISQPGYFGNLKDIFNASHGNELTVKFIYFLDYNQLRKKY